MKRLYSKLTFCVFLVPVLTILLSTQSFAHKVNLYISVEGDKVQTDCSYPDGTKVDNGDIEVKDSEGKKLLEGKTDKNGLFSFKIPKIDDLEIILDAHMGHKTSTYVFKEELTSGTEKKADTSHTHDHDHGHEHGHDHSETQAKPQKPVSRKEPVPVAAILGGLGFIFGLTALIMQLTGKKKS